MKIIMMLLLSFVSVAVSQEALDYRAMAIQNYQASEYWKAQAEKLAAENTALKKQLAAAQSLIYSQQPVTATAAPLVLPEMRPRPKATVIHGSGGGVYTTTGGATVIETVPGHFEVHHKDGTVERVIATP